jgi:hypothetical protein
MARKPSRSGPKYANGNYKSYQKAYDGTEKQKAKRAALNKENRKRGTYGNGDGKDVSHSKGGKTRLMIQSKNRAANGHGKRSRYA